MKKRQEKFKKRKIKMEEVQEELINKMIREGYRVYEQRGDGKIVLRKSYHEVVYDPRRNRITEYNNLRMRPNG